MKKNEIGLFTYAGKYKLFTIVGCIFSGISAILMLVPYICIWKVIDEIFRVLPNISEANNLNYYAMQAVIFSIVGILVYVIGLMCTHIAAFRIARNLKSVMLKHIMKLPLGFFNKNESGNLRRVIDESAVQTETYLAHQLPDTVGSYVTIASMLLLLIAFDIRLGILSLIPIIIGMIFMGKMCSSNKAREFMKKYEETLQLMEGEAVEYVRGIPVVKTFGQTVYSFRSFYKTIINYKEWASNHARCLRVPMTSYTVSVNACFALLVPAVILLISTVVDYKRFLLDFIFYIIFTPLCTVMLTRIMYSSQNKMMADGALVRIGELLNQKELVKAKINEIPKNNNIEFKNVVFSYENSITNAVDDISFIAKEGETVAFVGSSGSGKTTIASLIPRFFDVNSGTIEVGGINIKNIPGRELMDRIAFVFQDVHLFKGTLYENIIFSRPEATRREVIEAAQKAQCDEIFEKMPNGIDTELGSKGVYLSGGEMQRIALARAILKDAPIIILDEATAFADPENEYKIQETFKNLTKNKTVIMVAHRLSTIKNVNKIIVLDKGKIIEEGSHNELISSDKVYKKMWDEYEKSINWQINCDNEFKEVL